MGKKKDAKKAGKALLKADTETTHDVAQNRDTLLVRVAGGASEIADQPPLIAISAVTLVAGVVLRRPVLARTGARMLTAHLIATGIKSAVKRSVVRARPNHAEKIGKPVFEPGKKDTPPLNSFPSGHTAGAVAVANAVARDAPLAGLATQGAAGVVAALQPPRGTHYVSDVVVGGAIGWVSERAARLIVDRWAPRIWRRIAK